MGDFLLKSDRNGARLDRLEHAFRPSGESESGSWQVVWVASEPRFVPRLGDKDLFLALRDISPTFAFAAVDHATGTIVVQRDAAGLVPIRYVNTEDTFTAFTGPKIPSGLHPAPNAERLLRFLTGENDQGEDDFYQGMGRVRPGERLVVDGDTVTRSWVWSPSTEASKTTTIIERLIASLYDAVPESDAYTISGGLDSTALVGIAGPRAKKLWTMGFPEKRSDERDEARRSATYFETPIEVVDCDPHRSVSDGTYFLHEDVAGFGPIFVPNAFTESAFFRAIAESTTGPIVTGLGGDQVLHSNFDIAVRETLLRRPTQLAKHFRARPLRASRQVASTTARRLGVKKRRARSEHLPWIRGDVSLPEPTGTWQEIRVRSLRSWWWESATRLAEIHGRFAGRSLSMPWMDMAVVNALMSADPAQLFLNDTPKGLLREAMVGLIPDDIRTSQKTKGANKFVEGTMVGNIEFMIAHIAKSELNSVVNRFDKDRFITSLRAWESDVNAAYPDGDYVPTLPIWRPVAAQWWCQTLD